MVSVREISDTSDSNRTTESVSVRKLEREWRYTSDETHFQLSKHTLFFLP